MARGTRCRACLRPWPSPGRRGVEAPRLAGMVLGLNLLLLLVVAGSLWVWLLSMSA
jgi:hypothetical protein